MDAVKILGTDIQYCIAVHVCKNLLEFGISLLFVGLSFEGYFNVQHQTLNPLACWHLDVMPLVSMLK